MGYIVMRQNFRFYDHTIKKLITSRDIIFNEKEVWNSKIVEILIIVGEEVDKTHDKLPINTWPKYSHILNNFNSKILVKVKYF